MNAKIIYLNGFMASGKSTIGPILANTLGWDFYDLDKVIEQELGKSIVKIFQEEGEEYFREKETYILQLLSGKQNVIISLGGGTSSNNNNLELMKKNGKIIYLKASTESLYQRLRFKKDRPMLNQDTYDENGKNLKQKISELLEKRTPFYEQADLVIDTDLYPLGKTVDKIAKLIIKKVNEEN